jgi:hypothetical protein
VEQRAGYDIGQTLIPYTNDSTHFRALLVGLVNTLVVAIHRLFLRHDPWRDRGRAAPVEELARRPD